MPTREEKIAFLEKQGGAPAAGGPSRADKIAFLEAQATNPQALPDTPGMGQTALEGFGNGASLGYLPQLQAGAEKAGDAIGDLKDKALQTIGLDHLTSIDAQLKKQGFKLPDSTYTDVRDQNVARQNAEATANPGIALASKVAGGITTGIATAPLLPGAGAAKATTMTGKILQGAVTGARAGAVYGAAENPGDTTGEISPVQLGQRLDNAGKGMKYGAAVGAATSLIPAKAAVVESLENSAEKNAVKATGATGKQASNFDDGAGRELLDRKIVRFGDTPTDVAARAQKAVEDANGQIDVALKKLDAQGVKVDANDIYDAVRTKINGMKTDPSKADVAKILEGELDNVVNSADAKGATEVPVSEAEVIKRGYNRKAGNWADPEKSMAGKEMYQTYRNAVEDAATAKDPETAKLFTEGKKAYGTLAPIQEAAERRASTLGQSPYGGLGDISAAAVGMAKGGPIGALLAPVARRLVSPRLASMTAVTADSAAKALRALPDFASLESSNPKAFQAVVSQLVKNPEPVAAASGAAAAENSKPVKGPAKWANDGLQKLEDHAEGDDKKTLDKVKGALLESPKGRQLLVSASSATPGSTAMSKIMSQITDQFSDEES